MTSMAITLVLCVSLAVNDAEVAITPEIFPSVVIGILTSTTVILKQPRCYFDKLEGLPCFLHQCEIWLVVARGHGVKRFDSEKTSADILSRSPYPDAFQDNMSPNYFITRVGVQSSFPCGELPGIRYFQVGSEGMCDTANCNGALPAGETIRVKYILVDPTSERIESETRWSQPITLLTTRAISSIDESTWKRSAAMVVVTVVPSCTLAVLLLLLAVALVQDCFFQEQTEITEPPSLGHGIRRYNTHNVYNSEYYSNVQI
ncbi:uroplakin-3b-like protein 1 [Megalops cyprinoides]|uniref:uroplakin-3b-like protein 1 n=1 Tax=Megalops cyprinoides TaxID=118141 RepID=UPI0018650C0D|nr:uroplakin-3b-like protein 1 [Megalops cyprinoides]